MSAETPGEPTEVRPEKRSYRSLLLVCTAAIVVIGASVLIPRLRQRPAYAAREHPAVGKPLQQLQLQPLTGAAQRLSSADLRQRVTLINFWGTWCPPCRLELPHLVKLYRDLREQPQFQMISVSCNDRIPVGELQKKTADYLQRYDFADLPTYADPQTATRQHLAQLAGFGDNFLYPTTVIVDRQGIIRGVWIGVSSADIAGWIEQQRVLIKELLNEQN